MTRPQTLTNVPRNWPLRVSIHDNLMAFLNSAIVVLGAWVAILFLVWLSSMAALQPDAPQPDRGNKSEKSHDRPTPLSHSTSGPILSAETLIQPRADELPETRSPAFSKVLEAVVTTVSTVQGDLVSAVGDRRMMGPGQATGAGTEGTSVGAGSPPQRRWKIDYEVANLDEYRRLLEFFAIDLGIVDPDSNSIRRVALKDGTMTVTDSSRAAEADALYFVHQRSVMRRWDAMLAERAGIPLDDEFVVQFYPAALREQLSRLEAGAAAEAGIAKETIRRTVFRAQPVDSGFEFSVRQIDSR